MNNSEKIYLLEENKRLQESLRKISMQNTELLMLADFSSTLLVTTNLEKVTYIIIENIKRLVDGKIIKFVRKEPKADTYAYYEMKNDDIKKILLKRDQLGKNCFFMYCEKFYISNMKESFIAIPMKYEGENIGAIMIEEFDNKRLEKQNIKLIEMYSLISGIVIKNCLLTAQYQIEKKVILEQSRKTNEDLKYAQRIQEYLLPSGMHYYGKYHLYCNHIQAQYLGGDFYDAFNYNDSKVIFYIADISGQGVSSALLTLFLKQAVRGIAKSFNSTYIYPSEILKKLHKRFNDFMLEEELYIGILIGILDIEEDEIIISNAGHNVEPIHIETNEGKITSYNIEGLPISNWFRDLKFSYKDEIIFLDSNDELILLTDGATEVKLNKNEILGIEHIKNVLYKNVNLNCDEQFNELLRHIDGFITTGSIKDDIAFLCLKRTH